jgi:outer membrane protein assembly factor BamB
MQRLMGIFVFVGAIVALALALAPASATEATTFVSIIDLPNGHRPEGIAIGKGTTFYVGSLANGAVYRGDLRTGAGNILVPGVTGRAVTGLFVDQRHNYLFASGAGSGQGFVFNARTGETLATYQLAEGTPTFVNDVIVTKNAAYFTDSQQPFIYKVPLGRNGELPGQAAVERIPLSGDFVQVPGFNSNGIEASSNGRWLLIVHSTRGELYRVDPRTGEATLVDLGGASLTNGDGLRLLGHTL